MVFLITGILAPLCLLPPSSPQDRGHLHTLQPRGKKSFSLSALVVKIPGAVLALGFVPSVEGISVGTLYHHRIGASQKKYGKVMLGRANRVHQLWKYRQDPEIGKEDVNRKGGSRMLPKRVALVTCDGTVSIQ